MRSETQLGAEEKPRASYGWSCEAYCVPTLFGGPDLRGTRASRRPSGNTRFPSRTGVFGKPGGRRRGRYGFDRCDAQERALYRVEREPGEYEEKPCLQATVRWPASCWEQG